ncbi:hypothetical protein B0H14DRAFT_2571499 [Mycena olivaceomarginata]|nr:hypothetical protein B0H14DRAFT_2571499 [Mycena olivaceomarginata]
MRSEFVLSDLPDEGPELGDGGRATRSASIGSLSPPSGPLAPPPGIGSLVEAYDWGETHGIMSDDVDRTDVQSRKATEQCPMVITRPSTVLIYVTQHGANAADGQSNIHQNFRPLTRPVPKFESVMIFCSLLAASPSLHRPATSGDAYQCSSPRREYVFARGSQVRLNITPPVSTRRFGLKMRAGNPNLTSKSSPGATVGKIWGLLSLPLLG